MEKRPALGKGLSALIPDVPEVRTGGVPTEVDVDRISPNEHQPRHRFEDARLDELAQSIKANGVIQPIVVRKHEDGYRIIAGERRWRAAQRAGLTRVPVVVKDVSGSDARLLEMALVENIQREDLNPIDQAAAYEKLSTDFSMTQEEIAAAVGKDRSSVANHMRLLKLPQEVRAEVSAGRLSMGHARALIALADEGSQRQIAREVIARNLSVRDTEVMVKRVGRDASSTQRRAPAATDVHTRAAEEKLRMTLGTRVRINRKGAGGRIEIDFKSEDELQRLYEALTS
jgi:ParB family chromosome partitioning protein